MTGRLSGADAVIEQYLKHENQPGPRHPDVQITPAMVSAGVSALERQTFGTPTKDIAAAIYKAMHVASVT